MLVSSTTRGLPWTALALSLPGAPPRPWPTTASPIESSVKYFEMDPDPRSKSFLSPNKRAAQRGSLKALVTPRRCAGPLLHPGPRRPPGRPPRRPSRPHLPGSAAQLLHPHRPHHIRPPLRLPQRLVGRPGARPRRGPLRQAAHRRLRVRPGPRRAQSQGQRAPLDPGLLPQRGRRPHGHGVDRPAAGDGASVLAGLPLLLYRNHVRCESRRFQGMCALKTGGWWRG
jgi:hypothetical protein